uniref:Uncharacterized protein n=1 Tax=Trypanosoma congolense (strain IL3000) TaxID=1068625 RepID=G0UWJ2_TRYCI|nr:conserved hypothetical protein [Trypanosoma congolense IL3000]
MLRFCTGRLHGATTQPQSVLRTLLRVRQQYQRSLQNREVVMTQGCSEPQERQKLMDEAMKLLKREIRGGDTLSDVDATSAAFCIEVGKLLSVAATFGASSTTARVSEAIQWVRGNKSRLQSTRQVMSIAMPLMNLMDGRVFGRQFVIEELSTQLLLSLEVPLNTSMMDETGMRQYRNAVISVFALVSRLLDGGDGSHTSEGRVDECDDAQRETSRVTEPITVLPLSLGEATPLQQNIAKLLEKSVDVLLSVKWTLPPLEVQECVYTLQAFQRYEALCSAEGSPCKEDAEAMHAVLLRLRPMLSAALKPPATGAARRPVEVANLLDVGLKFKHRDTMFFSSVSALSLLPPAISSATIKDMCLATSLLARLRSCAPEACDALLVQQVVDAMRPKLFLLVETHPGHLRHVESSLLMSNLTRLDAVLSEDLVNLLCGSFASHMDSVHAAHLVPFLQGLHRFNQTRVRSAVGVGNPIPVPIWDAPLLPAVLPCVNRAADRVIALASSGALAATEVAHLLLLFSDLRSTMAVAVYAVVEPQLIVATDRFVEAVDAACCASSDTEGTCLANDIRGNLSSCLVLMSALDSFHNKGVSVSRGEEELLGRAGRLYERLRWGAVKSIEVMKDPKGLVMLLNVLTPGLAAEAPRLVPEGVAASPKTKRCTVVELSAEGEPDAATGGPPCDAPTPYDVAARQVVRLAPAANAYEVGALSRSLKELLSKGVASETASRKAMAALVGRAEQVELSLNDLQSLLDGMKQVRGIPLPASIIRCSAMHLQANPKKTLAILRHILPVLKLTTMKGRERDALLLLSDVAMSNVCIMVDTYARELSVPKNIALLAHALSQLHVASCEPAVESDGEVEEVDVESEEEEVPCDLQPPCTDSLQTVEKVFMSLGDAACACIQQSLSGGDVEGGGRCSLTPQEVVILVQSFERVKVRHLELLYEILPLVRDMSCDMEPLEISLLLSAFARLGVWNGRILNALACNVAERMQACSLRQCQAVLHALQCSRFLRPSVFIPSHEHLKDASKDWKPNIALGNYEHSDPLVFLATSVVERMNTLISTNDLVSSVLESYTLKDIAAVVRVLGFFEQTPQPTFDTYFALSMKKLVQSLKFVSGNEASWMCRNHMIACTILAGCVHKLRRYGHQSTAARVIAGVFATPSIDSPTLKAAMLAMPEEKLSCLYYHRCAFAMVYEAKFSREEVTSFLDALREKLSRDTVTSNPRRVFVVLRYMTKLLPKDVGNISEVSELLLSCAQGIRAKMTGIAGGSTSNHMIGTGEQFVVHFGEAAMLIESLCNLLLFDVHSEGHQRLGRELIFFFVSETLRASDVVGDGHSAKEHGGGTGSPLSARECCSVLLGAATVGASAIKGSQGGDCTLRKISELQRTLLMKERDISVRDSVNILLARALCNEECIVCTDVVRCASRVLQGQMGKMDKTGLWLLVELYRLVAGGDARFVLHCLNTAADDCTGVLDTCLRIVPTLISSMRSQRQNISPSLSSWCRVEIVRCLQLLVQRAHGRVGVCDLSVGLQELAEDAD